MATHRKIPHHSLSPSPLNVILISRNIKQVSVKIREVKKKDNYKFIVNNVVILTERKSEQAQVPHALSPLLENTTHIESQDRH